MPVVPALGRLGQEDSYEFKASLGLILSGAKWLKVSAAFVSLRFDSQHPQGKLCNSTWWVATSLDTRRSQQECVRTRVAPLAVISFLDDGHSDWDEMGSQRSFNCVSGS